MADKVILTARVGGSEWALVERRQRLVVLQDGRKAEGVCDFDCEDVEAATEAFYKLVRNTHE